MTNRRLYPPPDLERRSSWRDMPIWPPVVALILALLLMFSSAGATTEQAGTAGQAVSGVSHGEGFNCWYDLPGLERFCLIHTTERR